MSDLRLYYDFSCPWSYIALVRMHDVADRNACSLDLRPVVVDEVLATENPALRTSRFAENPAKAAWQRRDLELWARFWGLSIELPQDWPDDSRLAAAAGVAAVAGGKGLEFSLNLYRAIFGDGKDMTNVDVLREVAVAAGLAAGEFETALAAAATAGQVEEWTHELVRLGGFGTPTILLGDELFFGNDRIPLVDWMVGPISNEDFVMPGQHG